MIQLKVEKSADRNYVFMGTSNKIRYSVIITNTGDEIARCIKIKDVRSLGGILIPDSLTVNGVKQPICNFNNCVTLGSIKPGANILVSYDVEVVKYNPPTQIVNKAIVCYCVGDQTLEVESNTLTIPVYNICVNMCKSVDKSVARIGDILTYSVVIRNNSNVPVNDVTFYDNLSTSLELIPSSVLVNLTPQYLETLSGGVPIGTLNAYSSVVVNFQAKVISLPTPPVIKNVGRLEFSYTIIDVETQIVSIGDTCSNEVLTRVINEVLPC
ncbi:MAG: DUF11 domain-containing protein [Clostridium sp.]